MKILIISEKYPEPTVGYNNDFVHQRNRFYLENGYEVYVACRNSTLKEYQIDGINVRFCGSLNDVQLFIDDVMPDLIGIHFYSNEYFNLVNSFQGKTIIWVHGHEALNWYRRIYDYTIPHLLKHIPGLFLMLVTRKIHWRKITKLSETSKRIHFVFVSEWMKKIAEKDNWVRFKYFSIIPNGIDTQRFNYNIKSNEDRLKILSIRPYSSRKYANDITISTILELSERDYFDQLKFTLVGNGPDFDTLTKKIMHFKNVNLIKKFLNNEEIPAYHAQHGVFLCPTRQDSQGVSMCEAMSSGLVPVSSNNTAIPQFLVNNKSGLLSKNEPKEFARMIDLLFKDSSLFLELSENAHKRITELCDYRKVVALEMELFK